MNHYLQYHSMARMGRLPATPFYIVTNKSVSVRTVVGARIWLLLGETGRKTRYSLHSTFVAESVSPSQDRQFESRISASIGKLFEPPIPVDGEVWFPGFRVANGNFAFGFSPIYDPTVIAALSTLAGC